MSIRKAKTTDLAEIMETMEAAKGIMRSSGNMLQWTGDYPSEAVILSDIEKECGYVVAEDGRIIAYFALLPSPDPTYSKIYQGEWLDDVRPYYVVHRLASYPDVHHVFHDIMDYCLFVDGHSSPCRQLPHGRKNIRIDTHRDNAIMRHAIEKYGFTYCGIIYLENGDERLAFQRMIS